MAPLVNLEKLVLRVRKVAVVRWVHVVCEENQEMLVRKAPQVQTVRRDLMVLLDLHYHLAHLDPSALLAAKDLPVAMVRLVRQAMSDLQDLRDLPASKV